MIDSIERHPHDVLVVGAGGAGLRAAIEAAAQGASVGLVCKSLLGKAHTVMAEGGVAAALAHVAPKDSWQTHFRDTMVGGKLLNNWKMARIHAQEAPDRVRELERWGAVFDRTRDGRILQRPFGGHSHPRLAHVGDRTGLEMIRTLQDRAVAAGIEVYMECTVTRLLTQPAGISGALGYWRDSGRPVVFPAKAVVLATGGIGRCYQVSSNSWEYTGDGHALAYDAGAELIDMEFVQFHPTGMVWPPGVRGLLVTEAVRGEGGILRNKDGDRFMWRYLPEERRHEYAESDAEAARWVQALSAGRQTDARQPPELSTRDNVARAIYTEVREGRGSPHGGVFLDISHLPADHVRRKLPSMYEQFRELAGVDITRGPMEVGPTVHYVMGGIRVEAETGASTRAGLFAAGEVAGGMHGANRLGGNSLSDLLVFGQRAGAAAAGYATGLQRLHVDPVQVMEGVRELDEPFARSGGENAYAVQAALQELMHSRVGIFRTQGDLEQAIGGLAELRERWSRISVPGTRTYNPGWHLVYELRNLLVVAEAIARSAMQRRESRGAHARLDHPEPDPRWAGLNSVVYAEDGLMCVTTSSLSSLPDELRTLVSGPGAAPPSSGAGAAAGTVAAGTGGDGASPDRSAAGARVKQARKPVAGRSRG
jgi:succinate dehydrogenase / fumarate reductase flavoprotein subunit